MKIKVGEFYKNGYGAVFQIKHPPDEKCRWYEDDCMNYYHEDGSFVQIGGNPKFDLVLNVTDTIDAMKIVRSRGTS